MITLTVGGTTIELSEDLYWSDEFAWNPVEQTEQYSITGALIVSVAERQAGQPITLEPEDDQSGAITRDVLVQAKAWAAIPGQEMVLSLRGVDYDVIFRQREGAITSKPFVHYSDVQTGDFYLATFRFLRI